MSKKDMIIKLMLNLAMKIISMKRNISILSIESVAQPLWSRQPDSYGTNGSRYKDDQDGDRQNDVAVYNHLVFVFMIWNINDFKRIDLT